MLQHGGSGLRADDRFQLFTRRPADTCHAPKGLQQGLPPTRPNTRHLIEFGTKVPHRPGPPVERHRKAVGFVPDPLHEQQGRIVV